MKLVLIAGALVLGIGYAQAAVTINPAQGAKNYTPVPKMQLARYCTTNCHPTFNGGQSCITSCY